MHSKSPLICLQIAVVASKLAVANNFPQGDQAHDLTVRVWLSSRTAYYNENRLIKCKKSRDVSSVGYSNKTISMIKQKKKEFKCIQTSMMYASVSMKTWSLNSV